MASHFEDIIVAKVSDLLLQQTRRQVIEYELIKDMS